MKSAKHRIVTLFFLTVFLAMILCSADVYRALTACFDTIVFRIFPTLFPYLIFGSFLTELCKDTRAPKAIETLTRRLFSLPGNTWSSLFISALCGFPSGALCIARAYRAGTIDRASASRLLLCFTMPSPAFCLTFLGEGILGSKKLGLFLYISCFLTVIFLGILLGKITPIKHETTKRRLENNRTNLLCAEEATLPMRLLNCLRGSASAFALLCVTLATTSAAWALFERGLIFFGLSQHTQDILFCMTDLIGGSKRLSAYPTKTAALFAAFFLALQGLGVYLQSYSAHLTVGLKSRTFWLWRAVSGVISIIFMSIFLKFL